MRLAGVLVAVVAAFLPLHLMAGPEGENASEQVVEALPDSVMTSVSVVSPLDSLFVSSPILLNFHYKGYHLFLYTSLYYHLK